MKILWAFICRSSAIDVETNNISLFHIIEDIEVPTEPPARETSVAPRPMAVGSFEFIAAATRDDPASAEQVPARVILYFPDESPPETLAEIDIDLATADRYRLRLGMPGLPMGGLGSYRFAIEAVLDGPDVWHKLHEVTLELAYNPEESD